MKTAPIQESKRAFRQKLANAPIAEKLRMLDALRQRALDIRRGSKSDAAIDAETAAGTAKRLIKKNSELLKRLS
jgi:hypothetical protein